MDFDAVVSLLQRKLPSLLGVYAFGSRVDGSARHDSDLDLAVLVAGKVPPVELWKLASDIAVLVGCEVDLLDLRAASTVMQYQVITRGSRLWARDAQASLYEAAILSEKTELDTARAGVLQDVAARGSIYDG